MKPFCADFLTGNAGRKPIFLKGNGAGHAEWQFCGAGSPTSVSPPTWNGRFAAPISNFCDPSHAEWPSTAAVGSPGSPGTRGRRPQAMTRTALPGLPFAPDSRMTVGNLPQISGNNNAKTNQLAWLLPEIQRSRLYRHDSRSSLHGQKRSPLINRLIRVSWPVNPTPLGKFKFVNLENH